jgi:uncharacterized membrane protein YhhN
MTATPARLAPIVVFVLVSLLHLVSLVVGWTTVSDWTKPFLMPTLGIAALSAGALSFGRVGILLLAALALSTIGDIALLFDGSAPFIAGLSAFLLVLLMVILVPHLGSLLIPVVGYGVVIAAMAISATRCSPLVVVGATLFLLSDSVLAVNRFVPDANLWQPGLLIMLTYIGGQSLITWGLVRSWGQRARRMPSRPIPRVREKSTV